MLVLLSQSISFSFSYIYRDPATNFKQGTKIGQWIINRRLANGAFGDVYLVSKVGSAEKQFAMKVAPLYPAVKSASTSKKKSKKPPKQTDGSRLLYWEYCIYNQYLRGVKGVPQLPLGSYREDSDGFSYLVLPLLGSTLRQKMEESPGHRISHNNIYRIGYQLVDIMRNIHAKGLVYCDTKPENFMVTKTPKADDTVFCVDYGTALKYKNFRREFIRDEGRDIVGTVKYCSKSIHKGHFPGRMDDLISIGYVYVCC